MKGMMEASPLHFTKRAENYLQREVIEGDKRTAFSIAFDEQGSQPPKLSKVKLGAYQVDDAFGSNGMDGR